MSRFSSPLSITDLSVRLGRVPIVQSVTLATLQPNSMTVLAGPNGAGKSTLLRAISGLVPARGRVLWGDTDLLALSPQNRARYVGFMPQSSGAPQGLTVLESVLAATRPNGSLWLTGRHRDHALETLDRIGIADLAMAPLSSLSGGQRQLASLAQSLCRQPDILLLDEPTSALDLRHQIEVMSILRTVARSGCIVIVVLHDLTLASTWADHMVLLTQGRAACEGRPEDVLTKDRLQQIYGVKALTTHLPDGTFHLAICGLA